MKSLRLHDQLERLENTRRARVIALSVQLFLLLGVVDAITGFHVRLAVAYNLPIGLLAWRFPRWGAPLGALVGTAIWLTANLLGADAPQWGGLWVWNTIATLAGFLFVGIVLGQLRLRFEELKGLAVRDSLTGLLNRRGFDHALRRERGRAAHLRRALSLVYIDLDRFKEINDTLGHDAGDELLRLVADSLRRNGRALDAQGRLGGDEFAAVIPEATPDEARRWAERLLEDVRDLSAARGMAVTLSIGVVTFDPVPATPEELVRLADKAMYKGKRQGRNRVVSRQYPPHVRAPREI